jgi:hypothetical protein
LTCPHLLTHRLRVADPSTPLAPYTSSHTGAPSAPGKNEGDTERHGRGHQQHHLCCPKSEVRHCGSCRAAWGGVTS